MISMKADLVAPQRCDTQSAINKAPEGCRFPPGSIVRVPKTRNPYDGSAADGTKYEIMVLPNVHRIYSDYGPEGEPEPVRYVTDACV